MKSPFQVSSAIHILLKFVDVGVRALLVALIPRILALSSRVIRLNCTLIADELSRPHPNKVCVIVVCRCEPIRKLRVVLDCRRLECVIIALAGNVIVLNLAILARLPEQT